MAHVAATAQIASPKLPARIRSIQIFVRHASGCPYHGDEAWRRCHCRKHLRWSEAGRQFRQSARTRSWTAAEEAKRKLETQFSGGAAGPPVAIQFARRKTIEYGIELFLREKRTQGVSAGVIKKYERELNRLKEFMASRSIMLVEEIAVEDLTNFRAEWDNTYPSSQTRGRVQNRLRAFLRYCFELRWIHRVPRLSAIKVEKRPTLPFSDAEYTRLLKHHSCTEPRRGTFTTSNSEPGRVFPLAPTTIGATRASKCTDRARGVARPKGAKAVSDRL